VFKVIINRLEIQNKRVKIIFNLRTKFRPQREWIHQRRCCTCRHLWGCTSHSHQLRILCSDIILSTSLVYSIQSV